MSGGHICEALRASAKSAVEGFHIDSIFSGKFNESLLKKLKNKFRGITLRLTLMIDLERWRLLSNFAYKI